jgi:capsular polysaccharide biosynthesis protein
MSLRDCQKIHGNTHLHHLDPGCQTYRDVLYMPWHNENPAAGRSHGLYDTTGRLISAAARFVGPARGLNGTRRYTSQTAARVPRRQNDEPLFYLGAYTSHYGHFLVDTLCRLWALPKIPPGGKILYHGNRPADWFFTHEFAATILTALGLTPASFIKFDEPVVLPELIIAEPAIEELSHIHAVYARSLNDIGAKIAGEPGQPDQDRPIYLTKMNVQSGISHIVNESDFVDILAKAGIAIVAPESLPLRQQIEIFTNNRFVTGLIGSAFHTTLFAPARRFLALNYEDTVWSNQLLMDKANGNDARYVFDGPNTQQLPGGGKFLNHYKFADPAATADSFLRAIDAFMAPPASPKPRAAPPAATPRAAKRYEFALVACARWESRFIVEWLNHYRAIGYQHVFLYCNDDDPAELLERVLPFSSGPDPFVTFRHFTLQGEQLLMYADFLRRDSTDCRWVSFFDIDEFLRLPPDETIADFVERFDEGVDCILFNWVFFGPNGHKTPPAAILPNLTRRESRIHPFTKFIAKASSLVGEKFFDSVAGHGYWHHYATTADRPVFAVNVLGEDMRHYYEGFPDKSTAIANDPVRRDAILDTAVLHHYAFRSEAAFTERVERGLIGRSFYNQTLWAEMAQSKNFSGFLNSLHQVEDTRLADFRQAHLRRLAIQADVPAEPAAVPSTPPVAGQTVKRNDSPVSLGRPATQSSVSKWSRRPTPEADAAGAVDGNPDGTAKFHTALELDPWWRVDLGAPTEINEIRIYNRADDKTLGRIRKLNIAVSNDDISWRDVARKTDDSIVGSIATAPFIWRTRGKVIARFVRVLVPGRAVLHLDQVEVYGRPLH